MLFRKKVELFASVPTSGISQKVLKDALVEAFRKELNNHDLDFELFASVPTSGISRIVLKDALVEAFRKELNNHDLDFETVGLFDGPTMFDQASLTIYMEVDNG